MKLLLTILIVSCSFCSIHCSKSHPITTLLNAKWSITPVSLEVAEYLFDENPALFWDYVEALSHLETPLYKIDGDSKLYKSAIKAAEKLIGPTYIPLLKLSLSMHTTSPRIQAHFQIANDVIAHGDCNTGTFVTIGNRVACNMKELKKGLERVEATSDGDEEIYNFDHIYPGSENNTVTTVLYSDIGSEDFQKFHEYLKKEALVVIHPSA